MLKKILKYTFRTLLVILLVLILVPALLYIPAVQDFVRSKAVGYASRTLGMDLSVERLRLSFPLRLSVDNTLLTDKGDTLLSCGHLSLEVAVWPLLRKEVAVRSLELAKLAAHYRDSTAGMDLKVAAGQFAVNDCRVGLPAKTVGISRIALTDGDVFLNTAKSAPAEKADSAAALPWQIDVGKLTVANLVFGMRTAPAVTDLSVRLPDGEIDSCRILLDSRQASVKSILLNRGGYAYLTAPADAGEKAPDKAAAPDKRTASNKTAARSKAASSDKTATQGKTAHPDKTAAADNASSPHDAAADDGEAPALPWTVRIGSVALNDNSLEYGTLHHRPAAGFDPAFIVLSPLDLSVDSIYNRGADIALRIRRLAFTERSGLSVRNAAGAFAMDSTGISLSGFELATPLSGVRAEAHAGAGIMRMAPDTPLTADLSASLNTEEIKLLYPQLIPAALDDRIVRIKLSAAGTLGDIKKAGLDISSPGHIDLAVNGTAKNLLAPQRLEAAARFEGEFRDMAFLLELLPDTALRRRVTIPERITLRGAADADRGLYSLASTLTADGGQLTLNGRIDPEKQIYDAEVRCDSLPLNRFLPADSLGALDFTLTAGGAGFDPLLPQTRGSVRMRISRAEYRSHDFGGIELDADLENQHLSGRLYDRDEALRLLLSVSGTLTEREQRIGVSGNVFDFDLADMGITPEQIGGSFALDADASASDAGGMAARLTLDSIVIRSKNRTARIRRTNVTFGTDTAATRAGLTSGDLTLSFAAPEPLDSLTAAASRSAGVLAQQIRSQHVDMDSLKTVLPDFGLRVSAGRDNILSSFLRTKRIAFSSLDIAGTNCDSLPVSLRMRVEKLAYGSIVLDTLTASAVQNGSRLEYALRVANAPGNLDNIALAGVYGHVVRNTGALNFYQKNRAGREGFRFGVEAQWNDSLIRASVTPLAPVFGSEPWTVNPGNYLVYRFDGNLSADLDMTHGDQRFAIHTVPETDSLRGIRLDIAGLNIGGALAMLPSAPPVGGVLGAAVTLNTGADSLAVRGDVSVAGLSYDKQRFGDVGLGVRYAQGREQQADVRLTLDGADVLTARGDYRKERESPLDITASIPGFPLQRADVFLPADMLRLSGILSGKLHAGGTPQRLQLNGGLQFAQTEVRVPMIGTSFRLSSDTIRIDDSRVLLDDFAVTAPNKSPLTIGGYVDLTDFGRITADIALRASDFQFVNVARKEGTAVYGKAYLDLDATAKGPLDELVVRGSVALLKNTDINYVMQDSPMDVKERPQNIVTFVSFRDMDNQSFAEATPTVRIGGMDILLNVDINDDVQAAVDLSADGSNRIDLQGGGNLTFTMNPLGDIGLSGKYVLSGGTVRYNPPVISQKIFKITPDSYVDWVGNVADPAFNITAVETVRASVSADGQDSRSVNFNISINIRNTLNDLEVSFGLSAPEDLTMQNQLNSLTAEQRANQAMNLLIYNTYTGPGTTAKVSTENPLNSFIQKELNQWAQNNLKGVDLSFGIDSYGEDDPNGQRTDYSYRLSKNLFSNRVRAVIGGKFSTDADPSQNLKENLIDDISLEYMLTKRDNMYLKVFRHTGYESILEGEITETGVGFVIRKKLLRLGDLFKPMRPKAEKQKRNESDARQK